MAQPNDSGEGGEARCSTLDVAPATTCLELQARRFRVSGVDGSEEMLKVARRLNPQADIRTADVEALPFEGNSFDWIPSIKVLRYLPDFRQTVKEMGRVLKPGGTAVVTARNNQESSPASHVV